MQFPDDASNRHPGNLYVSGTGLGVVPFSLQSANSGATGVMATSASPSKSVTVEIMY